MDIPQVALPNREEPLYHLVKIGLLEDAVMLLQEERNCSWWHFKQRRKYAKRKREREWLLDEILAFWGDAENTYCVSEPPITYFDKWRFADYRDHKWVEYLLQRATHPHYVLLGFAPCLQELLPKIARNIKSLSVYVRERECTAELENLLEDLFEDFGLATDIHLLDEVNGYRKLTDISFLPCNVMDFSKEERLSPWVVPADSIWLDFDGTEEKWRRIEGRNSKIHYFSLIKEWKNAQNIGKSAL